LNKPDYFAKRRVGRRIAIGAAVLSTVFGGLLSLGALPKAVYAAGSPSLSVATNLSVAGASVVEGNSGTQTLSFAITNAVTTTEPCVVNVTTANVTAANLSAIGLTGPNDWELPPPFTATDWANKPLVIPAGAGASWPVNVIGDTTVELDETFTVTLSLAAAQGTYGTDSWIPPCVGGTTLVATGTIKNDDTGPAPTVMSITGPAAAITEGNSGTTPMDFVLTAATAPVTPCQLWVIAENVAPAGGTPALWGLTPTTFLADWTLTNGGSGYPGIALYSKVVTINSASTTFTVDVIGDTLKEVPVNEQLWVRIVKPVVLAGSAPNPCDVDPVLAKTFAYGTITDDDSQPPFSVATPAPITEGDSGTAPLDFVISAPSKPNKPCQLWVIATNGAATYGADESASLWGLTATTPLADWTLTNGGSGYPGIVLYSKVIAISEATTTFTVDVIGDLFKESPSKEKLTVTLVRPVPLAGSVDTPCELDPDLAKQVAVGTILDNDSDPLFSISGPEPIVEGDSGAKQVKFVVKSNSATATACQIQVTGQNVTAAVALDWTMDGVAPLWTKTITIPAGGTSQEVIFNVLGDTINEGDETFQAFLTVAGPAPCPLDLTKLIANATIVDDDATPIYSLTGPATIVEGNAGVTTLKYTFSSPTTPNPKAPCQILATALNGSAIWLSDWKATGEAQYFKVFTLDAASGEFNIDILGDTVSELDELYTVNIVGTGANPCLVDATKRIVTTTIINDDAKPVYALTGPDVIVEGNSGVTPATYTIATSTGTTPSVPCQVLLTALNGTAGWTLDWNLTGQSTYFKTITIDGTSTTSLVDILGELLVEADETYTVNIVGTGANPCLVDPTKFLVTTTIKNDDAFSFASPSSAGVVITNGPATPASSQAQTATPAAATPSTTAAPSTAGSTATGSGSSVGAAGSGASFTGAAGGSSAGSSSTTTSPPIVAAAELTPAPAAPPAASTSKVMGEVASVAYTGSSSSWMALFALTFIAVGFALLLAQRRTARRRS
jgi:Calx-beta domain